MKMEAISKVFHQGASKVRNALTPLFLLFICGPVLSGCVTTGHTSAPLVPPPPVVAAQEQPQAGHDGSLVMAVYYAEVEQNERYNFAPVTTGQGQEYAIASAGPDLAGMLNELGYERENVALSPGALAYNCEMKDRFDRKEVLAYEWDRSRLGLDLDGINTDGDGGRAVRVNYTLRLQPEKTSEQRCRYPSAWQGMAGSAYNELMLRESDTVWQHLRQIRKTVQDRF